MAVTLLQWLGSRTPEQLAAVLAARPDAAAPPIPPHLRELSERLELFRSVATAVHELPTPGIQVIEVLQLLGPEEGTRPALASWLGRGAGDPDLAAQLDLLARWALVWPDGELLRMAQPLYQTFPHPLRLGPPATQLLAPLSADQLRRIALALDVPGARRKLDLAANIAAALADQQRVRELVAAAAPAAREALVDLAEQGPPADPYSQWYAYYHYQPDPALRWALDHGLAVPAPPGYPHVPREVTLALRGPGWHAPFTPQRPEPPLADVDPAAVQREAAASGAAVVEQVSALLELLGNTAVALLKTGGVGVRELRRLAKATGTDEALVRLWLELACEAGLVAPVEGGTAGSLAPTTDYDTWADLDPAHRLAQLLLAWAELPATPLAAPAEGGKPPPALVRDHDGLVAATARTHLIGFAASLPAGRGIADPGALGPAVSWHAPLRMPAEAEVDRLVAAAWREAELVGVVAHGALTSLGRALVAGDPLPACQALLPGAVTEAVLQADLTALVPGTPAAPLAELLDAAADREGRGAAATWRFSAGSVRRALDAGLAADDLLAALRERAVGSRVPQPLAYLVADVARRHGTVRVRPVACLLHAQDPTLLAEIARNRALQALQLSVVAPTVLGSAKPVIETLAALRGAGYAPVGESAGGVPQLERATRRRAAGTGGPRRPDRPERGRLEPDRAEQDRAEQDRAEQDRAEQDRAEQAAALLAAPVPPPAPKQRSHRIDPIRELERQLRAAGYQALPGLEDLGDPEDPGEDWYDDPYYSV